MNAASPSAARALAGWVDHDRGAVFVVAPEVAVDIAHQHLHDERLSGQVLETRNPL